MTFVDLTSAMRRIAVGFVALSIAAGAAGLPAVAGPRVISPDGPAWIKPAEAPLLFEQCSRRAPVPEGKLWFPTAGELEELEARLVKYLGALQLGTQHLPASGAQFRGQYAGFVRANVKYIYGSYSLASDFGWKGSEQWWPSTAPASEQEGLGGAVRICDGGHYLWGIVYNPATGEFSDLEVNGP